MIVHCPNCKTEFERLATHKKEQCGICLHVVKMVKSQAHGKAKEKVSEKRPIGKRR